MTGHDWGVRGVGPIVHLARGHMSLCGLARYGMRNSAFAGHIRDVTCKACHKSLRSRRRIVSVHLASWASDVATRYQAPVYLVGSTLSAGTPRDTDVCAVLPDAAFERRWMLIGQWIDEGQSGEWTKVRYDWARECAGIAAEGRRQTLREIDFQAIPASAHATFEGAVSMLAAKPSGQMPRGGTRDS